MTPGAGQAIRYAARTAPARPETVWTLEPQALVEDCGRLRQTHPLAQLSAIRLLGEDGGARRAAELMFDRRRVVIPARSLTNTLRFEDRSSAFDAFLAALQSYAAVAVTQPRAPKRTTRQAAQALIWTIGLTAAGALFMIAASLLSGFFDLGLALGARLLFAPIVLSAALPWFWRLDD